MSHRLCLLVLAPALLGITYAPATAQRPVADQHHTVAASSLIWTDPQVPGFAPGMKLAIIHGDPSKAAPYTLRLSFPDGYRFPPHWHPSTENLTVLEGTFLLGMGERASESSMRSYASGEYHYIPARMPHYGGAKGYTVIQLHGTGPFTIELVRQSGAQAMNRQQAPVRKDTP